MQLKQNFLNLSSFSWLTIGGIIAVVLFCHLWMLGSLPQGLYVDESSIGLNAASIATNLTDEHGKYLPVYFEAFGEYKNPLYIYTASLLFKVFGVNDFILRFTSFIFYTIFATGLIVLVKQIFPQNKTILGYSIVVAGFLPWIFTLSRISFEVISQPAVMIWALYFFIRAYVKSNQQTNPRLWASMTGIVTGLSVYSYSTSRLLSFAFIAFIFILYTHRQYWKRHGYLLVGAALSLIPYAFFSLVHSGALTHRFSLLTYVFNTQLSLFDKVAIFLSNYFSYFDLNFLLFSGDPNTRHHTGYGGEIFISVYILFLLGIAALSAKLTQANSKKKFILFLFLNLASAPVAAALTEPNHSLRSVMLGVYIIIFSTFGLALLQQIRLHYLRYLSIITILTLLIVESGLYLHDYFNHYPVVSVVAFESYDFKHDLARAIAHNPHDIVVSSQANQPYAHLEYYAYQIPIPTPIAIAEPIPTSNRCIIYFGNPAPIMLEDKNLRITLNDSSGYSHLRCYGDVAK